MKKFLEWVTSFQDVLIPQICFKIKSWLVEISRFLKYPICENKLPPALITQKAPNKTLIEGNTSSGGKAIKAVLYFDQGKFMLENFIV